MPTDDRTNAGVPLPKVDPPPYRPVMLEMALRLHRTGLRLLPLVGKRAIVKDWPNLRLGESDVRSWCGRGVNWGIITGEPLVVLDTDTEAAEAWVKANGIDSTVVVRTGGRGWHRYFLCPEDTEVHSRSGMHKIDGLDLKGWRSYIVAAGSVHPGTRRKYEYLPGRELTDVRRIPAFNLAWIRESGAESLVMPGVAVGRKSFAGHVRDVRAYIRRIPSIQGQGGDKACFTVACLLVEAGLDFASAVAELEAWNEVAAFPPWRHEDLERKVRYAFKRVLNVDGSGKFW